mgnify:CR=1 FL=1
MKKWFALSLLALWPALAMALVPVEGKDYTRIASPTPAKPGVIEVREFFWYGCPHCYKLEAHVVAWKKTLPADVKFIRTPAALNPVWENNARGFYVAESLGLVEKTHGPLFHAIQIRKERLFDQASLAGFYAGHGIDKANFNGVKLLDGSTTSLTIQTGSKTGDTIAVNLTNANAAVSASAGGDVTTVANANTAMTNIDTALDTLNAGRAVLGAGINRLDAAVSNLSTTITNLSAARGRIMDADFASETASLTRSQILQQAGTAMLAQANQLPNNVLSLLK